MEDFDEAEEMNEEDLLDLGDAMGNVNLKVKNWQFNSIELCVGYFERFH